MADTCIECIYWNQGKGEHRDIGTCRRYPPLMMYMPIPIDHWCGEYEGGASDGS